MQNAAHLGRTPTKTTVVVHYNWQAFTGIHGCAGKEGLRAPTNRRHCQLIIAKMGVGLVAGF